MSGLDLPPQAGPVIVHLCKGVLYADQHALLWRDLLNVKAAVRDYVGVIGLEIFIDEAEGYAFLRQHAAEGEEAPLPRLVQRRPLGYAISLMCVLLRKKLAEQDTAGGATRLVLTRSEIVAMSSVFFKETDNEARLVERIDQHISRLEEYGFLRRLKGPEQAFEVRRILKALVDASWLADLDEKLKEYRAHASNLA
ncbi:DUF4194 domain-containing protein [Sorangium sp. So ce1128]